MPTSLHLYELVVGRSIPTAITIAGLTHQLREALLFNNLHIAQLQIQVLVNTHQLPTNQQVIFEFNGDRLAFQRLEEGKEDLQMRYRLMRDVSKVASVVVDCPLVKIAPEIDQPFEPGLWVTITEGEFLLQPVSLASTYMIYFLSFDGGLQLFFRLSCLDPFTFDDTCTKRRQLHTPTRRCATAELFAIAEACDSLVRSLGAFTSESFDLPLILTHFLG